MSTARTARQALGLLARTRIHPPRTTLLRPFSHRTPIRPRPSPAAPLPLTTKRTIFIQTETTPNVDALKFRPNARVIPEALPVPYIEYLSPRDTISPPHPSPLAAQLLAVDGVQGVFYGADFITVTKAPHVDWAHVKPEVFALITQFVTAGTPLVEQRKGGEGAGAAAEQQDSLAYDENDEEVVGMIKELLETRIRPAIQEDGGDIEYRGFENGMVLLKLRGACRTCSSGEDTLKQGIEGMLMHYIEEVKGVQQVQDPEEEISAKEFAKFEEKLQQHQLEKQETQSGSP